MEIWIISILIFTINIAIAILARFKVFKRSYPPEHSQTYALIWGFIILLQFIIIIPIYNDLSESETILIAVFSVIFGITIYIIFRNGYEDDVSARTEDFRRLKYEFDRLAKNINHDIEEIECCFYSMDNIDHKALHLSIRDVKTLMWNKDAFCSDGAFLDATKDLLDRYMICAYILTSVRAQAAKNYKHAKLKNQPAEKEAAILQVKFYEAIEKLHNEHESYIEKIKETLLYEEYCNKMKE